MHIFLLDFPRGRNLGLLAFLLTLGLSACGGGGGGGGSFSGSNEDAIAVTNVSSANTEVRETTTSVTASEATSDTANETTGNDRSGNARPTFAVPSKAKVPEIRTAISVAATSRINGGRNSIARYNGATPYSSTQASPFASEGSRHRTQDEEVHFEWLPVDGNREPWVSFYPESLAEGSSQLRGFSVNNVVARETRSVHGHAWVDLSLYRRYSGGIRDYFDSRTGNRPGEVWVYVHTDADGDGDGIPGELEDYPDTDYLAGGVWLYVPETAIPCVLYSCNIHQVGAFANGNDPFDGSEMDEVMGSATYEGRAIGVHTNPTRTAYFEAKVRLTANFGSETDFGSMSGEIFDITGKGGTSFSGAPTIQLGVTGLFGNSSTFFGNTTHNDGSDDYTGEWGGRFYGNSRSDGMPGSAAGTFGATNEDGSKSYLGAFGAHHNN